MFLKYKAAENILLRRQDSWGCKKNANMSNVANEMRASLTAGLKTAGNADGLAGHPRPPAAVPRRPPLDDPMVKFVPVG